ncbi:MAG: DNA alkylation repair protein, partial [Clostridia bacterium]|nr:DNA alkylation repair protein [Clostridia bacterium]
VGCVDELLSFPDEYYEVTFIKLTAVSLLKWEEFIKYVDKCVPLIDNWATCDCFAPKCIVKHKEEFLPYIYTFFAEEQEFYQRFALTTLLHFYVEEKYYDKILQLITEAETDEYYYVHMAAAWLLAELIIKFYDQTVEVLKATIEAFHKGLEVDKKTHNKAIQKACESFRLTAEQKTYLKGLKL